jgi:hypothetical protein
MEKEQIKALLENASDDFLESFYETLLDEINCDDEPYHKRLVNYLWPLSMMNTTTISLSPSAAGA